MSKVTYPLRGISFYNTGRITHSWNRGESAQRRRAKFDCPPALKLYLEKNRQVPADASLKPPAASASISGLPSLLAEFRRLYSGQREMRAYRKWTMRSMLFGGAFRSPEERFGYILATALDIYREFYFNREFLNRYVDLINAAILRIEDPRYGVSDSGIAQLVTMPESVTEWRIEQRSDGFFVETKPAGISEALNGVYGDRLRRCRVCQSIFWAKRRETLACSSECQNTLRTRQSRSRTSEEKAELARKARGYYSRNQALKKIRGKNGNLQKKRKI